MNISSLINIICIYYVTIYKQNITWGFEEHESVSPVACTKKINMLNHWENYGTFQKTNL